MSTVTQQVSRIRTRFKQDPNEETINDDTIVDFLNEAQDIIESQVIVPAMQTSAYLDLVADQREYTLEDDLFKLVLVRYNTNDWVLEERPFAEMKRRFSSSTGSPQEYYFFGNKLGLNPVPSGNETGSASAGIEYWYLKTLDTLVEESPGTGEVTTSEIPVNFHWVLERGAEMLMAQMVNDSERSEIAETKFQQGIQLMKDRYASTTDNLENELTAWGDTEKQSSWLFSPYQ